MIIEYAILDEHYSNDKTMEVCNRGNINPHFNALKKLQFF